MTKEQTIVNQTNSKNVKNLIQVSNTKKPLFFYVNLAKRYLQQHSEIELSALGMAITTVVTIAEILKNKGFANEKSISTCTTAMKDESKGRMINKARIIFMLEKADKFNSLMAKRTSATTTTRATTATKSSHFYTVSNVEQQ